MAAELQLALQPAPATLQLDGELQRRFLDWSRWVRRNSPRYVDEQAIYLRWWATQLTGVDLREISLRVHVVPALDQLPRGRTPRVALLKVLFAWLHRHRHELERDPVAALRVPQSRPEQWRRRKVVAGAVLRRTVAQLAPRWRDAVTVLAGTGWHVTELQRFACAGEVSPAPWWARRRRRSRRRRRDAIAGVLETVHKHGERFRTCVSHQVLAAASRLRGPGELRVESLRKAIRVACDVAGVARWGPGQLRHTVATWAVERGEDLAAVAAFLGHRDARTTRRFYVELYTAPKVATPR